MPQSSPASVAAFLTWIAGFVDAVGFISLAHIYTANMSGNSIAIGIQAVLENWPEVLRRLCPVLAYLVGLIFCRLLIEFGARQRVRSIACVAFLCEIGLLVPAFAGHAETGRTASALTFVYVALLATAMGIQNAALTHFGSLMLHTGFVTGTLVKLAEQAAKYLTWAFDQIRAPGATIRSMLAASRGQKSFRLTVWLSLLWVAYVAGACCGALADNRWKLKALLIPIVCLASTAVLDVFHPLAIAEEAGQSKLSS